MLFMTCISEQTWKGSGCPKCSVSVELYKRVLTVCIWREEGQKKGSSCTASHSFSSCSISGTLGRLFQAPVRDLLIPGLSSTALLLEWPLWSALAHLEELSSRAGAAEAAGVTGQWLCAHTRCPSHLCWHWEPAQLQSILAKSVCTFLRPCSWMEKTEERRNDQTLNLEMTCGGKNLCDSVDLA